MYVFNALNGWLIGLNTGLTSLIGAGLGSEKTFWESPKKKQSNFWEWMKNTFWEVSKPCFSSTPKKKKPTPHPEKALFFRIRLSDAGPGMIGSLSGGVS